MKSAQVMQLEHLIFT